MKWRLIKQALCPLKALNRHKAGLLKPFSDHVYELRGEEKGEMLTLRKINGFV